MLNINEYRQIRKDYFNEGFIEANNNYHKYKAHQRKLEKEKYCIDPECTGCDFPLAPLPKAVPVCQPPPASWWIVDDCIKKEGKTPMRYNDNYASASANVLTVQSDTATQRDYLMGRLSSASYPKENELRNVFNLYVDNCPKTYKDLIDAIKNDKFTIDSKVAKRLETAEENGDEDDFYIGGPFIGIIWAGPQPDPKGFSEAMKEKSAKFRTTADIIMSGVYADGLKALQDFEAWLPTPGAIAS